MSEKNQSLNQETNKTWASRYNKSNDMIENIIIEDEVLFNEHEERMRNWKGKAN